MIDLRGALRVNIHPLPNLRHELDLIYYEGPFLSLFRNAYEEPYLYYWCDSDELYNRWLIFRIPPEQLTAYVNKRVTLRDLVLRPSDNLVYIADIDNALEIRNVFQLQPHDLPGEYIPEKRTYYASEPVNVSIDLEALADLYQSDLFNIHLLRGTGVEFGSASITTLGSVLATTGALAESLAVRKFAGTASGRRVTKNQARLYGTFQYITEKAASFSAILRPLVTQISMPGFEDRYTDVVTAIFEFLDSSRAYDDFRSLSEHYGDDVVRNLERLMEAITNHGLDVQMRWIDREGKRTLTARANTNSASTVLKNIKQLEFEGARMLRWTGRFTALDVNSRRYSFESTGGTVSSGKIVAEAGTPITRLTFEESYSVEISRNVVRAVRSKKPRLVDVMLSIRSLGLFDLAQETKESLDG